MDANHAARREEEIRRIRARMEVMGPDYSISGDPYFSDMFPIMYAEIQAQVDAQIANQQSAASDYNSEDPEEREFNEGNLVEPENNEEDPVEPDYNTESPEETEGNEVNLELEEEDNTSEENDDEAIYGDLPPVIDEDGEMLEPDDDDDDDDDDGWIEFQPVEDVERDAEFQFELMNPEPVGSPLPPPPPEEEPESEVEDAIWPPPQPPQPLTGLPAWIQWRGHNSDLNPNTYVYVSIEPVYPCTWKLRARPFYLGPVLILSPCRNGYLRIAVPQGFERQYSEYFFHTQVSRHRPEDLSRIISQDLDFEDPRTYTEKPMNVQFSPKEDEKEGPLMRVTWKCYGKYEKTLEPEARMRLNYPNFFD